MKKFDSQPSGSCVDTRIRFKHQALLQDYQELRQETEFKMRKLEMMRQKKLTLTAQVRFLRRRYKHLMHDQTLEANPKMSRLPESSGDLKVPSIPNGKRKKHSGLRAVVPCSDLKQKNAIFTEKEALANNASCDLEKNPKRSRGNWDFTNSVSLPDLNGDGDGNTLVGSKVPGFDLNEISREDEDPGANGEHMVTEATNDALLGNGSDDLHGEIKLPVCRDVEKELNRAVKRKVTWQDPVALSVGSF